MLWNGTGKYSHLYRLSIDMLCLKMEEYKKSAFRLSHISVGYFSGDQI